MPMRMMPFKPPKEPKTKDRADGLVTVSLKTLVDLAKPAASLQRRRLSVRARQSGDYVSSFKGRGMEFDETRLYQPGDDIRNMDWRVTARTDKPHTKLFREERERPVFIAVDDRPAMHFATQGAFKSVIAAKLAALLAWSAQQRGDRIGGQLFSEARCREFKPQHGKPAVLLLLQALVKPEQTGKTVVTFEHALARLAQHVRPGSVVYLISDFRGLNTDAETYLAKLSRHCEVKLIFLSDPLENELPGKGLYRLTDAHRELLLDTGDQRRVESYRQRFSQRLQHLERFSKKHGISLRQCRTVDDPLQVLK